MVQKRNKKKNILKISKNYSHIILKLDFETLFFLVFFSFFCCCCFISTGTAWTQVLKKINRKYVAQEGSYSICPLLTQQRQLFPFLFLCFETLQYKRVHINKHTLTLNTILNLLRKYKALRDMEIAITTVFYRST